MSMTRDEAIDWFEQVRDIAKRNLGEKWTRGCEKHYQLKVDLAEAALSALRFPTREMVERMRGEWIIGEPDVLGVPIHCSRCGWGSDHAVQRAWMEYKGHIFCGHCGAPMTDEAVDMMAERMREIWTSE